MGATNIAAGGEALPDAVRKSMEATLNADLSGVRVHSMGSKELAAAKGVQAYTQGTDIFFQPGAYQPHSPSGQKLLGHELTHVVQQKAGKL